MQPSYRPRYETQKDRDNEAAAVKKVSEAWGVKFIKLKPTLHLDYALYRDKRVVSFAEVKVRTYTWEQIDRAGGYMLALDKWVKAHELCVGMPFTLIVQADGELRVYKVDKFEQFPIMVAGRRDRGDWRDVEPCVFIPVDKFSSLESNAIPF